MENMTVAELRSLARTVEVVLRNRRGYATVSLDGIMVQEKMCYLSVYLMDDFQKGLDYNDRYHAGQQVYLFETPAELWAQIGAIPSLEMRELSVLLKHAARLGQATEHFRSAQAQAFAQEIIAAGEKYRNLLEKG